MKTANLIECRACGIESEKAAKCPVCGAALPERSTKGSAALDRLTKRYTAWDTFTEFCDAMERNGYTPTIHPNATYKGRKVAGRVKLIEAVRAAGFKVYDGTQVA